MDDLIYVIALIAWVAFAFYRKSQKKSGTAREARQQPQPRTESRTLPTLEEILMGKEPDPEPVYEAVPSTAWTEGMSPVLEETAFEKEYNLRGISSVEELDGPMILKRSELSEIQEHDLTAEGIGTQSEWAHIDLRKAVIYSEILNRPYV